MPTLPIAEVHVELVIVGLLVVVAAVGTLARVVRVPYPILLVIAGAVVGLGAGENTVELDPDLVLILFLPPLLYVAAFYNNPRELLRNTRPIGLLAIGLVVATMLSVAVVAHYAIGLSWQVAFVLGAIVSPTDAVAPATIVRRLGVPRRLITIIEGESLTNDWTALTIYKFAVAAVVTGSFSLLEAGPKFLLTGFGGLAVGLVVGELIRRARRKLHDPPIEITISLFSGFAAYIPAEELGVSGVIAAVTVGLYMGWYTSELTNASTRIQINAVWDTLDFLLNAVLFLLVGLQLPTIIDVIDKESPGRLAAWGLLVGTVVIVTRIIWVFVFTYGPRWISPSLRKRDPSPSWRAILVLSWCGMRGAVALAAALALPLEIDNGSAFPDRDLVIFLVYAVIAMTLIFQGLTLPALIRFLGVTGDDLAEREGHLARVRTAEAALARLDELEIEEWTYDDTVTRTRGLFEYRLRRFGAQLDGEPDRSLDHRSNTYARFMLEVIAAERTELERLRNAGEITDEVKRSVEQDLDYEEARYDLG